MILKLSEHGHSVTRGCIFLSQLKIAAFLWWARARRSASVLKQLVRCRFGFAGVGDGNTEKQSSSRSADPSSLSLLCCVKCRTQWWGSLLKILCDWMKQQVLFSLIYVGNCCRATLWNFVLLASCCTSQSNENHENEESELLCTSESKENHENEESEPMCTGESNENHHNLEYELGLTLRQGASSPDCQKWCCCGKRQPTQKHHEQLLLKEKRAAHHNLNWFQHLVLSDRTPKKARSHLKAWPWRKEAQKIYHLKNVVLSIFLPQPCQLSAALDQEALERGHWTSFITHHWRPHGSTRSNTLILDNSSDTKHFLKSPAGSLCIALFSLKQGITMKSTFTIFV